MGKIAWYGSSNDANNSNLAWSIGVTADGNDWTSGSNRKGFITFNNHNGEQLRITSSGYMGIGTNDPNAILHTSVNATDAVTLYLENRSQDAGNHNADKNGIVFGHKALGWICI